MAVLVSDFYNAFFFIAHGMPCLRLLVCVSSNFGFLV